jgi:lipoprotein NlpI
MNREATPKNKKTFFGQISDFNSARNELDEESYGELVMDVARYEGDKYESAQEIARAFHQDDPAKYNQNQMNIRDVAKEFVTDMNQPEWSWDILSFYSKDMGVKMLDVPSGGHHKGLLVTDPEANQE